MNGWIFHTVEKRLFTDQQVIHQIPWDVNRHLNKHDQKLKKMAACLWTSLSARAREDIYPIALPIFQLKPVRAIIALTEALQKRPIWQPWYLSVQHADGNTAAERSGSRLAPDCLFSSASQVRCHATGHGYEVYPSYAFLLSCTNRQTLRTSLLFCFSTEFRIQKTFLSRVKRKRTHGFRWVPNCSPPPVLFAGFRWSVIVSGACLGFLWLFKKVNQQDSWRFSRPNCC